MPQNTVVFNGAAVNLMSTLIESVRADMRAMRVDLVKTIDDRFSDHEDSHAQTRQRMTVFQSQYDERLRGLETAEREAEEEVAVAKAKREGQLAAINSALSFMDKYGKYVLGGIVFILGLLTGVFAELRAATLP
jgi:hypothetical protein